MTDDLDAATADHLWDPRVEAPADVAALERSLTRFRFDASAFPLVLPARTRGISSRRWLWRAAVGLTAAAALVLAAVHHWSWPDNRPWPMTTVSGGEAHPTQLEVGRTVHLGPAESAHVDVARIGVMDLAPGTDLTLRATASNRHRLALTTGALRVRVWGPPGAVVIQTPAGDAVDLGCRFRLSVGAGSATRVTVTTGWVQLDNVFGEMLVPAGASASMSPGSAPLVPIFDDAARGFREGARTLERLRAGGSLPSSGALAFARLARTRDVLTLLLLARTAPPAIARPLLTRAAGLVPPPEGVAIDAIVDGNQDQFWRWFDALDLPPAKHWWLNWRDALGFRGFDRF